MGGEAVLTSVQSVLSMLLLESGNGDEAAELYRTGVEAMSPDLELRGEWPIGLAWGLC